MEDISLAVLGALAGGQAEIETRQLASKLDVDHQQIVGAVGSIQALAPDCLTVTPVSESLLALTAEGQGMVENGSHEARVFEAIPADGIVQSELLVRGVNPADGGGKLEWLIISPSCMLTVGTRRVCQDWTEQSSGCTMDLVGEEGRAGGEEGRRVHRRHHAASTAGHQGGRGQGGGCRCQYAEGTQEEEAGGIKVCVLLLVAT